MVNNQRPNILWICTDQQRWDTLGVYGNEFVKTPNLDRLAQEGAVFHHTYSQHPMCTPSRACFLTGRYPRTVRCIQNGQVGIPEYEVLVTKMLADAGYTCGLSGKLHLSPCNEKAAPEMERRIDDGYSEFHWSHHPDRNWETNEYQMWLDEKGASLDREQIDGVTGTVYGPPEENHQTTWCAEKAVDFMNAHKNDASPWLFSVNIFDPHHMFDAPKKYMKRYEDMLDEIPLPNYVEGELENKSEAQKKCHQGAYGGGGLSPLHMTERDQKIARASYWAMCDLIDVQVGRMLEALEESGQRDNTLVLFMSDHGEMLGDHGIYFKGAFFYECAMRVPLIFSWPGRVKNLESRALVELTDLPQTILDALDMEYHPGMQGKSLWPILTGEAGAESHRDDVYAESYSAYNPKRIRKDGEQHTMVRTKDYKICVDHVRSTGELYDLNKDPNETHNVWDDDTYKNIKCDMLLRMANRAALTVDPLPEVIAPW